MGKKYIIEIPEDKIPDFVGSTHFLMPYMMAGYIGHHDTGLLIEPYTEPDLEQIRKEAYEKGREYGKIEGQAETWVCVKKIAFNPESVECVDDIVRMGFDVGDGNGWSEAIEELFEKYSAHEAIEKIRQYEQEKEEIKVGDEVATDAGNRASVLYENPDGTQVFVFKSDGTAAWWTKSALHRTGRNFPEIATILEKMRGEQDG